jgi:LuxR family maltose regulon positive regulatory protein
MAAMTGDPEALTDHLKALEEVKDIGPLPDGTRSVESATAMIRGVFGYDGPLEMTAGAERAMELETDGRSPYHAIAHMARGHAAYVAGDLDLAVNLLAKASYNEAAPPMVRMLTLSVLSLAEAERGHQDLSRELAEDAMQVVDAAGLSGAPHASFAFTALGLAQAAAGEMTAAAATIEQGLVLRRKNPAQGPWGALHHILAASRVAVLSGERGTAKQLAEEASARMDRYPQGMECMRQRLRLVEDAISRTPTVSQQSETLTDRELEVLRLLQGSLSLSEIAKELYISPNTVKTHAKAVYRKLGVGSRHEAVQIARGRQLV